MPPADVPPTPEVPDDSSLKKKTDEPSITTTETELEVFDYVRRRLSFLIDHDENLFRKLDHISFRDYKGTFAISYKQDRKGRLFNFRETANPKYRFEFPESGATIATNDISDIDAELLAVFLRRTEELG